MEPFSIQILIQIRDFAASRAESLRETRHTQGTIFHGTTRDINKRLLLPVLIKVHLQYIYSHTRVFFEDFNYED